MNELRDIAQLGAAYVVEVHRARVKRPTAVSARLHLQCTNNGLDPLPFALACFDDVRDMGSAMLRVPAAAVL